MSRIYKICVVNQNNESANEVFAIKPLLGSFDSFKDDICIRMPEMILKMYYQDSNGDNITIHHELDFEIFKEQKISKVFVIEDITTKSVQQKMVELENETRTQFDRLYDEENCYMRKLTETSVPSLRPNDPLNYRSPLLNSYNINPGSFGDASSDVSMSSIKNEAPTLVEVADKATADNIDKLGKYYTQA